MATDFDVAVIGSGFGGAICGARLAEAGYRVLILERGRRWDVKDYPRAPADPWLWDHDHPEQQHGFFDLRMFPHMTVAQGAGVGGGSLVYANISVEAKPDTFASGWPPEVTYDALAPHYARVGQTMNVQKVPEAQWPARTKLLKAAAAQLGYADRFRPLELAVTFDPAWTYDQANPHDPAKSKTIVNAQGQTQGTCVHLGDCDIGCDVKARNTLDLNYIPIAETARRRRQAAAHRAQHPARRGRLSGVLSGDRQRRPRARHGHRAHRHRRGGIARIDGAAAAVPRRRDRAAADQRAGSARAGAATATSSRRRSRPVRTSIRRTARRSPRRSTCSTAPFAARPSSSRTAGCRTSPTAVCGGSRRAKAPTIARKR